MAARLVALRQRQDHAPLDQLLLALHSADRRPESARRPAPSELFQPVVHDRRVEAPLLEVVHPFLADVACRLCGRDSPVVLCRQHRDLTHSERMQTALQSAEQVCANPAPARLGCHRPSQHPGSLAVDARRDGADDLLADLRHERRLSCGYGGQHFCERERRLHVSRLAGSP